MSTVSFTTPIHHGCTQISFHVARVNGFLSRQRTTRSLNSDEKDETGMMGDERMSDTSDGIDDETNGGEPVASS